MKTPSMALYFLLTASGFAAGFQAGDLVAVRLGDGSGTLTSAATPVWLDEYTPGGALVQSIALPTASSGDNYALTMAGNSASEGQIQLSADGQYLTVIGYNAAPGTAGPSSASPSTINRVIGLVGAAGVVDSSTAISDPLFTSNPRGVVSDDGTHFWASSGSGNGLFYIDGVGASATSTQLGTGAARTPGIYGGQLYASVTSSSGAGIAEVGTGLPTSSASLTLLSGFPTSNATRSTWGYVMADRDPGVSGLDTAWVADDKVSGGDAPGVQHWSFDGFVWNLDYTLSTGGASTTGARALTVDLSGPDAIIYATTTDNRIVRIDDDGTGSAVPTDIVTGAANTFFRGIAFAPIPEPQSLVLFGWFGLLAWKTVRRHGRKS
jgi:hypothetical protein